MIVQYLNLTPDMIMVIIRCSFLALLFNVSSSDSLDICCQSWWVSEKNFARYLETKESQRPTSEGMW